MGLFGGDNENEVDDLLQQQYDQNAAALAAKKSSIYKQKLEIMKGQGGQIWEPTVNKPAKSDPRMQGIKQIAGMPHYGIDPTRLQVR